MTLRWLLNENFPQPAVLRLRTEGWDVTAIGEDSPSVDDEVVMARACAENRGLATFDRDYGELVFKRDYLRRASSCCCGCLRINRRSQLNGCCNWLRNDNCTMAISTSSTGTPCAAAPCSPACAGEE
jgi:predicted nuclease of predicted toxin-antitoxin system